MKTILVLGAGRSSSSLISYLLERSQQEDWNVIVGDMSEEAARDRVQANVRGKAIHFDIGDEAMSAHTIAEADVVISLLPAHLHPLVAKHCLKLNKHLLNASYVSEEMKSFGEEARAKQLLFMNECGLDPGIDHMSAMQVMDTIRRSGGSIISFESFTGGLIAPDTDPENPWRYKFTWNPRNVVMAGQGMAKFLKHGQFKYIPYQQLFSRTTSIHVEGLGDYEGYPNRDSLKYIDTYGLQGIQTMVRGTLRNSGYCPAWNVLVQLGCCDDSYLMEGVEAMTHRDFINAFLDFDVQKSVEEKLCHQLKIERTGPEMHKLQWSGFFDTTIIGLSQGTPAQILEHILNKKWKLEEGDRDQIVMWHRFVYEVNGKQKEVQASLIATGDNALHTAMAKTVGLPLAIVAKLLLQGKISQRGIVVPMQKEIYDPVLQELKSLGIALNEKEIV